MTGCFQRRCRNPASVFILAALQWHRSVLHHSCVPCLWDNIFQCLSVVFYLDLTDKILIHLKSPDSCECTPENLRLRVNGKHFDRLKDAAVGLLQSALSCWFWFALVYKIETLNAFAHWMLTICASISCVENIQYSTYLFVILPFTWTV